MQQFSSTSYQFTRNDFEWGGGGFIILKELYGNFEGDDFKGTTRYSTTNR